MKKLASCLALSLFALVLLLPLSAQGAGVRSMKARAVAQDGKNELYEKFHKNMAGDINAQRLAYEAGKEYLQKYPNDTDAKAKEIKDWVTRFENQMRPAEVLIKVYREKNYPEAYALGKQVLATDPENLKILTALGYAGMFVSASGNTDFTGEAMTYAKQAIQLLDAGKAPPDWKPFSSKDETLGWLNYALGLMTFRTTPHDAIGYLSKAAQYEAPPKKDPLLYYYLATLRSQEFEKQRSDYNAKYNGKDETPESKAALEQVNALLDPVIDAFARAVAYADADPQMQARFQQQRTDWMTKLTDRYRFRHNNSEAGLKELIDSVRTKPLGMP
jgi:hypothetical protein